MSVSLCQCDKELVTCPDEIPLFPSENVAIIGNRFSWDPVDKSLLGVEGDVVHTLNKEHSMCEFFAKFEKDGKYNNNRGDAGDGSDDTASNIHRPRPNVILLGDSLGDARMTLNLEFVANVIKVNHLWVICNKPLTIGKISIAIPRHCKPY